MNSITLYDTSRFVLTSKSPKKLSLIPLICLIATLIIALVIGGAL